MELMTPGVPGIDGLPRHIVEHPALARLHAGLMHLRAEHVIVVTHDHAVVGVDDGALVAFNVEDDARDVGFLDHTTMPFELVMSDGEETATECIGIGY